MRGRDKGRLSISISLSFYLSLSRAHTRAHALSISLSLSFSHARALSPSLSVVLFFARSLSLSHLLYRGAECGAEAEVNMAHIRQSEANSGLGFQVKAHKKSLDVVPFSLGSGPLVSRPGVRGRGRGRGASSLSSFPRPNVDTWERGREKE